MGSSSRPFLYGPSFHGPTERPFNPKAVTHASWAPKPPKPQSQTPLVSFNRHPDPYSNSDGVSRWTPMSPRTKGRVKHGRSILLCLRVLALVGAVGSLFCAVVIKGHAAITWIIRVGPIVAILHTLYGVYHLRRSVTRPPGSQGSYMVFAAIFDLLLIPFYVFAAYIGRIQYTAGSYNWDTLFDKREVTSKIARAVFLLSVVNGGLHAISLGISISLAVIFRHITQLPPDLNPLEDNLTARPHKRNKSELTEKHLSHSTLDSGLDDPLIEPPRQAPIMHTRGMYSGDATSHFSSNNSQDDHPPQVPMHHDHSLRPEPARPEVRFRPVMSQANVPISQIPVQNLDHVLARPTSAIIQNDPVWDPSAVPERSQCVTPASDNWVAYPSRSPTPEHDHAPADDALLPSEDAQHENPASRAPSSMFARSDTSASTGSGLRNWLNYSQRYGRDVDAPIAEETRGEYESLATHEYYGNDEESRTSQQSTLYDTHHLNTNSQDLGDHRAISIHLDDEAARDEEAPRATLLPMNPLGMNPPTPQPTPDNPQRNPSNPVRTALTDVPSNTQATPATTTTAATSPKQPRFYASTSTRGPATASAANKSDTRESKRASQKHKSKAYATLKQYDHDSDHDDDDDDANSRERDRKGRVVSNSGADITAQRGWGGLGSSLSYGNYIAGLGVGLGRRRDVSGKVVEEGRSDGGDVRSENTAPRRAAGWARFAGL
ncbi:hypothetical protein PHISP_05560 [Aspergillus sp. HF37]|nr:hypothetical protein PHISP_05560 [Aspergillus sp. HF37]